MVKTEKISEQDFIDPNYRSLMKTKKGKKLIQILRLIIKGSVTVNDIQRKSGFSTSEVKKLLVLGIEREYIKEYKIDKLRRRRGRPIATRKIEDLGRPPKYYYLTGDGKWLMRFDPEVRDCWSNLKETLRLFVKHSEFHSFADFMYEIRKHPQLREFQRSNSLMENMLEQITLRPFVFGNYYGVRIPQLYDELVRVLKESVYPDHIPGYYTALETSLEELKEVEKCHELLLEKMQAIPEVLNYLRNKKSPIK